MIKKIVTLLFFSLLVGISLQAQEGNTPEDRYLESTIEQRALDRKRWADLTEGINYTEKKQRQQKTTQDQGNPSSHSPDNPIFGEGTGTAIARFLLIVLGAIGIALLVRSMLGYGKAKDKKIKRNTNEGIDIQKIEENIHEADLEDYIGQAKAKGNYNLAIRLYYLAILKELSLRKDIKWKVDKTNNEYVREMRGHVLFPDFQGLTRIFERSWYGDSLLNQQIFNQLEPGFQHFIDRIALKAESTS